MTSEPVSTERESSVPQAAAEHLTLAERFSSFAEYATSTATLPQTAATSLDVARFHAFTGEMTFSVDPAVRLYLDGGSVYHAERHGGPSVGRILLDAGVVDSVQLQRGVVHVGDVEHLGRLFDRDTTVDRDAVMVVVEGVTDKIVQQIANSVIATVTVSAYRHHPTGIHRWFVAPVESTALQRPASGVMQVDRSVVEELPLLGAPREAPSPAPDSPAASMTIEWADPDPSSLGLTDPVNDDPSSGAVAEMDIDIQAELDRFDADRADWAAASGGDDPDPSEAVPSPLGEFRIVWPDGTRDESIVATEDLESAKASPPSDDGAADSVALAPPIDAARAFAEPDPTPSVPPAVEPASMPSPTIPTPAATDIPVLDAETSGAVGFTTEPMQIDRIPEPDAAVPDDVAAAVRRALQAIESAAETPSSTAVPEMPLAPMALPEVPVSAPAVPIAPAQAVMQPAPGASLGFAPPTADMRAEAVYERAATEASTDPSGLAEAIVGDVEASHPAPSTASVVFVEDDDNKRERRGALRRLIGSLRSKD